MSDDQVVPFIKMADVWRACSKIRAAIFRSGLDLWAHFLPLDPNRDSLLPECQFVGVLAGGGVGGLGSVLALSSAEIAQLADYFRTQDGRVLYAQLCRLVHGTDPPTAPGPRADGGGGDDECQGPPLESVEALRVRAVLAILASRQLPLEPYFQDYELVARDGGGVTFPHFGRVLRSVGVSLAPDDFRLLVRTFRRDACTLHYPSFLRAVRAASEAPPSPAAAAAAARQERAAAAARATPPPAAAHSGAAPAPLGAKASVPELMLRVQAAIQKRIVRVSEFFRDFDPLNSGRVSRAQFVRAASTMGVFEALSPREWSCLLTHYADPNRLDAVCWRTFEDDCDRMFTVKELEKHPELRAGPAPPAATATAGAARPAHAPAAQPPAAAETDILLILAKIKTKVVSAGLRPLQFLQQHDPRNELVIPRADFYRSLTAAGLALSPLEMDTLMEVFAAPGRRRLVEYQRFCDTAGEAIVQGGLERAPLLHPVPHVPAAPRPHLNFEERCMLSQALTKLAAAALSAGADLRDALQAMDERRCGRVTRGQAERALSVSGVLHVLSARERDLVYKCFSEVGDEYQVSYRPLCGAVDALQ